MQPKINKIWCLISCVTDCAADEGVQMKTVHRCEVKGHSLALAGQVVHARLDILIVRIDLDVVKVGL